MQGRDKRQQESNEKVAAFSVLLLLISFAILAICKLIGWPL